MKKKTHNQRITKLYLLLTFFITSFSYSQTTEEGCPEVAVSTLKGSSGFDIAYKDIDDFLGSSAKNAGDINNDGIEDFIIGAPEVSLGGIEEVGEAYVIFGSDSFSLNDFDLNTLDGTNGFTLRGVTSHENMGSTVSTAGDFNNDGIDDVMIGQDNGRSSNMGAAIIIFGRNGGGFMPLYTKADINGTNGIVISTTETGTHLGYALASLGDINGDTIDDIGILDWNNFSSSFRSVYIIYGSSTIASMDISSLNGSNGFSVTHNFARALGNQDVIENIGDINGDNINDFAIGIPRHNNNGISNSGVIMVVFGQNSNFPNQLPVASLDGTNGFLIESTTGSSLGSVINSAGDFNNDGIGDFMFSEPGLDSNSLENNGRVYIVYGKTTPYNSLYTISDFNASNSTIITGSEENSSLGQRLSLAKDLNQDTIDDLLISNRRGVGAKGSVHILYGQNTPTPTLNSNQINGTLGHEIYNNVRLNFGFVSSLSGLRDINNDSYNDFIIGSYRSNTHVIFGNTYGLTDTISPEITCPNSTQQLPLNGVIPDYRYALVNVEDNCTFNQNLVITQTPPIGTLFTGNTTVTLTVADASGNTNSCSFEVQPTPNTPPLNCSTTRMNTTEIDGTNGSIIFGEHPQANTGTDIANVGDINNDGFDDFGIAAQGNDGSPMDPGDQNREDIIGGAYIVYGTASGLPPTVNLSQLNGTNGFKVTNDFITTSRPSFAYNISPAGDLNNDGIDDFITTEVFASTDDGRELGYTFIIFGNSSFPSTLQLSTLNGTNGFIVRGIDEYERIGYDSDALGDINGDGLDDIALVEGSGDRDGEGGKVFILYGSSTPFPRILTPDQINGTNGFVIVSDTPEPGTIGYAVSGLGDVNGDAINDIGIAGDEGRQFVVFGRNSNFPSSFNIRSLNGNNGFSVFHSSESIARGISNMGDINNDGFNEIGFGFHYIVFGKASFSNQLDLNTLDGINGFKVSNSSFGSPSSLSTIGDFDNDGIDDFIIGDRTWYTIVFGQTDWDAVIQTNTSTLIRKLNVVVNHSLDDSFDLVAKGVGDLNNDGLGDIAIGAPSGEYRFEQNADPGFVFVFYGQEISDIEPPEITDCPTNQTLATGTPLPDYTLGLTVSDDCDTMLDIVQSPAPGTLSLITQTVTITVTDDSGKEAICSFVVSDGSDTEDPVISCIGNQTLDCNTTVIPDYTTLVTATDNIDTDVTITQSPNAGSPFTDGMTVTFTATDDAGNDSQCNITITTNPDTEDPVISCIGNQNLNIGDNLPDYTSLITVTDNCDNTLTITQNPNTGSPFIDGMTVTFTATDDAGNDSQCSITITANADTEDPVISCIRNQTLDCNATVIPDYTTLVTATDNIDTDVTITQNPVAGSPFTDGMTVTFTATDDAGNDSQCNIIITTNPDTEDPVISCIGNQNLTIGDNLPDYTSLITATDNCDNTLTIIQNPSAGSPFTDGMTVTFTATDDAGNDSQCSIIIIANADTEDPVISCIRNQTLDCNATVIPDYTTLVTATDNIDTDVTITQNPVAGSPFTDGMTVTFTATDDAGNSSQCNIIITTNPDTEDPVISCIGNQNLNIGDNLPDYTSLITATDNCDNTLTITQNPSAGSPFTDGMTVTFTATDDAGNDSQCSIIIIANPDTEDPVISCPANQTLDCNATVIPDYTTLVTATDNIDTDISITQNPVAGSLFTNGMTVTFTATDDAGNSSQCNITITTNPDTEDPVISCIGNQNLNISDNLPDYTSLITATDNCDNTLTITQNPNTGSPFIDGMTVTFTATDDAGNDSQCSITITANADTENPVISCPANQTLDCNATVIPNYTTLVTATDNIDTDVTITQNPVAGSPFTDGMTITFTATDDAGNSSQCNITITTNPDTEDPVISCIGNQNLNISDNLPDYTSLITATDNCDNTLTIIQNPNAGSPFTDGMTVTFTATDDAGNTSQCSIIITANADTENPVISCPANQTLDCNATVIPDYTTLVNATDNIDTDVTITQNPNAGSPFIDGMTVTFTATDDAGNSSQCSIIINEEQPFIAVENDIEINLGEEIAIDVVTNATGVISWSPTTGLDSPNSLSPLASPEETTTYTVTLTTLNGCIAQDEITISVIPPQEEESLYGFSPDNDGINDFWEIKGIENFTDNEVYIYNRWGDLVFQIRGYNNTTNVFRGEANRLTSAGANSLPEGTYFFDIKINSAHNLPKLQGFLVLKR